MKLAKRALRSQRGAALLFLMLFFATAILILLSTSCAGLIKYFTLQRHSQSAAEAAALAASRELSTVIVLDPSYGYIGLSDKAPSPDSMLAEDGKPVPVTGINTLVATARANMLVAKHLNNEEFLRLARVDAAGAREASRRLVAALKNAMAEKSLPDKNNQDGKAGKALIAARRAFVNCLQASGTAEVNIKKLNLDLGYLNGNATTSTPLPPESKLAEISSDDSQNGCYKAFRNLSLLGESFIFAAVGKQPSLVARDQFLPDSDKEAMPSSIVRVRTEVDLADSRDRIWGNVFTSACAAPFTLNDRAAPGVMILAMPDGHPCGFQSLADYISDFRTTRSPVQMFKSQGGDYPLDARAYLVADVSEGQASSLSNVFVQGLYDWVRTAHGRFKPGSLLAVIGSRLQPSIGSMTFGQSLIYRFDQEGNVVVDGYARSAVPMQIVHDQQIYTLGLNSLHTTDAKWTVAYRDQVRNLGTESGGKHAGQLMEMSGCLRPAGSFFAALADSAHGDNERKTYFDGGLAVEFVISSPQYN